MQYPHSHRDAEGFPTTAEQLDMGARRAASDVDEYEFPASAVSTARRNAAPTSTDSTVLHWLVALGLTAGIFAFLYASVLPNLTQSLALGALKPDDITVVNFNGVYASPAGDAARFAGRNIERSFISGEFLLDCTPVARSMDAHGYIKAENEWVIKSPFMGEEAFTLTPFLAFFIPLFTVSFLSALGISLMMPRKIGLMAELVERAYTDTKTRLLFDTNFDEHTLDCAIMTEGELEMTAISAPHKLHEALLAMRKATRTEEERAEDARIQEAEKLANPNADVQTAFNRRIIASFGGRYAEARDAFVQRFRETFSGAVERSINNLREARAWRSNRLNIFIAIRLFMSESFAPKHAGKVQGLVYAGAGLLIIIIGLRGLRFIPASRPSLIFASLALECALVFALGLTMYFQYEDSGSTESLKRIENNTHNVSFVLSSVNTEILQQTLADAVRARALDPEMEKKIAEVLAQKFVHSIRQA